MLSVLRTRVNAPFILSHWLVFGYVGRSSVPTEIILLVLRFCAYGVNTVDLVDEVMNIYYALFSREYSNEFKRYCQAHGFDDAKLQHEIAKTANDCCLTEFDENFPIAAEDAGNRKEAVYNVLRRILGDFDGFSLFSDPKYYFATLNDEFFTVTAEEVDKTMSIYSHQCSCIPHFDMRMVLAAERKNNVHYIQHLIDMCSRDLTTSTLDQWMAGNPHCRKLMERAPNHYQSVKETMDSYFRQVCHMYTPSNSTALISDSLEEVTKRIFTACLFVEGLVQTKPVWPFQMDFIIAFAPKNGGDLIDNIRKKLDDANVCYVFSNDDDADGKQVDDDDIDDGVDSRTFKRFVSKMGSSYPSHRRFCVLLDRRNKRSSRDCDLYIYQPPPPDSECIPVDYVPFWFMNSSKTWLTLSFHAMDEDQIRAYLYFEGTQMRFMPNDLVDFLPKLFTPTSANRNFVEDGGPQMYAEKLAHCLFDVEYEAFQKGVLLNKRDHFHHVTAGELGRFMLKKLNWPTVKRLWKHLDRDQVGKIQRDRDRILDALQWLGVLYTAYRYRSQGHKGTPPVTKSKVREQFFSLSEWIIAHKMQAKYSIEKKEFRTLLGNWLLEYQAVNTVIKNKRSPFDVDDEAADDLDDSHQVTARELSTFMLQKMSNSQVERLLLKCGCAETGVDGDAIVKVLYALAALFVVHRFKEQNNTSIGEPPVYKKKLKDQLVPVQAWIAANKMQAKPVVEKEEFQQLIGEWLNEYAETQTETQSEI